MISDSRHIAAISIPSALTIDGNCLGAEESVLPSATGIALGRTLEIGLLLLVTILVLLSLLIIG